MSEDNVTDNYVPNWLPYFSPEGDLVGDVCFNVDCSICGDVLAIMQPPDEGCQTYCILPCGHAFGYTCTTEWMDSKDDPSGPSCRKSLVHAHCGHKYELKELQLRDDGNVHEDAAHILGPDEQIDIRCDACLEERENRRRDRRPPPLTTLPSRSAPRLPRDETPLSPSTYADEGYSQYPDEGYSQYPDEGCSDYPDEGYSPYSDEEHSSLPDDWLLPYERDGHSPYPDEGYSPYPDDIRPPHPDDRNSRYARETFASLPPEHRRHRNSRRPRGSTGEDFPPYSPRSDPYAQSPGGSSRSGRRDYPPSSPRDSYDEDYPPRRPRKALQRDFLTIRRVTATIRSLLGHVISVVSMCTKTVVRARTRGLAPRAVIPGIITSLDLGLVITLRVTLAAPTATTIAITITGLAVTGPTLDDIGVISIVSYY
ncbi:hypothetical protein F4778DRAFT_783887 [Xylariomycetidae sp. FL2044]|nr:hypothetical protein F4778DRAFT_783887 [Xylariomycetidae sp. FL2044]